MPREPNIGRLARSSDAFAVRAYNPLMRIAQFLGIFIAMSVPAIWNQAWFERYYERKEKLKKDKILARLLRSQ
jgi:hypothetical protein